MICVANPPSDWRSRSVGYVASTAYQSERLGNAFVRRPEGALEKFRESILRVCFFLFVCFSLSAPLAKPQTTQPSASSIETIAGGEPTSVPGVDFGFASVSGLAADTDGSIYFSIQAKSRVYRLGLDAKVTVFAGNGVREKNVDGVSAGSSPILDPRTLAVDIAGNLYIVCANALVRVDRKTGLLSTVFSIPYSQPGSPDSILDIIDMVVGPDGNLYFSDGADHRIKTYSFSSESVSILAGNGMRGPTQPGVPAISSPLRHPQAVAVGSDGTIYFSTLEPYVFCITPQDGKLQVVNIGLPEQQTPLGEYDIPSYISVDEQGHLFVAQANRSRVLRIVLKTGVVSTYAGTGAQGFNGDDIKADRSNVTGPSYVLSDPAGNLIIAENSRIRSVDSSTRLISTRVGNGYAVTDGAPTVARDAKLWEPADATPAADGSVYISSSFDNRLMRLDRNGELITVAGGGEFVRIGTQPGSSTEVALTNPQGIWLDKNNEVFLSDPNGGCVWRTSRSDGTVELYVGTAPDRHGRARGGGLAGLAAPSGLALDSAGNLYIADGYFEGKNGRILRVDGATRSITTVLSNLRQPSGLAFQSPEVLCFSESGTHQVRCMNLESHTVKVVAGTGEAGYSGDGGPAECAQLNRPFGISFGENGDLYIADTGNQRIRRVRMGLTAARCHP